MRARSSGMRIACFVSPYARAHDEFSQGGHLGEGWRQMLGGAWSRDANRRHSDHDAARPQCPDPEHRRGELQSRPLEHRPILLWRAGQIAERLLLVAQPNGYMRHDEPLQSPGELVQTLRLGHQVVLQALRAQPFAFLEYDGPDDILSHRPRSTTHADDVTIIHVAGSKGLYRACS